MLAGPEMSAVSTAIAATEPATRKGRRRRIGAVAGRGIGLVVVSHDMRVIQHLADQVVVMYAGRIVEQGPTAEVCGQPRHPYTQALLTAVPRLHSTIHIAAIAAETPPPMFGCPYAHRCPLVTSECSVDPVPVDGAGTGHSAWCYHPGNLIATMGSDQ